MLSQKKYFDLLQPVLQKAIFLGKEPKNKVKPFIKAPSFLESDGQLRKV